MISRLMDLAPQLSATNFYAIADISEWETITIQVVGLAGTCTIAGTNDGGEITGVIDGTAKDSTNYNAVQAINLTTGATAIAVTGTTLFRIYPIGFKYLRLGDGSTFGATKVLIHCTKPY